MPGPGAPRAGARFLASKLVPPILRPVPTLPRRTLRSVARFEGVTLFTGVRAALAVHPAAAHHGLRFRRADLPGSPAIPATHAHVVPESRRTVLSADPADPKAPTVQTVEHLLSALAGLGITDALVELHGPEVPIADGSAAPFVDALTAAGVAEFARADARVATVAEPIVLDDAKTRIEALPLAPGDEPGLHLTYRLDYGPGAPIPAQEASLVLPLGAPARGYAAGVAPARTFCLAQEAQAMRQMGLFTHLSPRDMLVIGPEGPVDNAYRFPDEPARHKLLDLLGDLALSGVPVSGRVVATRTGHAHNHAMAKRLAALIGA